MWTRDRYESTNGSDDWWLDDVDTRRDDGGDRSDDGTEDVDATFS